MHGRTVSDYLRVNEKKMFWSGGDVKLFFIVICRLESCANDGSEQMDCEMKVQGC